MIAAVTGTPVHPYWGLGGGGRPARFVAGGPSLQYQTLTFNIEVTLWISLHLRAAAEPRRAEPGQRQHYYLITTHCCIMYFSLLHITTHDYIILLHFSITLLHITSNLNYNLILRYPPPAAWPGNSEHHHRAVPAAGT